MRRPEKDTPLGPQCLIPFRQMLLQKHSGPYSDQNSLSRVIARDKGKGKQDRAERQAAIISKGWWQ